MCWPEGGLDVVREEGWCKPAACVLCCGGFEDAPETALVLPSANSRTFGTPDAEGYTPKRARSTTLSDGELNMNFARRAQFGGAWRVDSSDTAPNDVVQFFLKTRDAGEAVDRGALWVDGDGVAADEMRWDGVAACCL